MLQGFWRREDTPSSGTVVGRLRGLLESGWLAGADHRLDPGSVLRAGEVITRVESFEAARAEGHAMRPCRRLRSRVKLALQLR